MATLVAGCGPPGTGPSIDPVDDQVVGVGQELVVVLQATDADGDDLVYSFSSDVPGLRQSATISELPVGAAEFRWTPKAGDEGTWFIDFRATDGSHTDRVTVKVDVRSAVGDGTAPVFRKPLGTGTTLNLDQSECVELDVVVDDSDTSDVKLSQEPPLIDNAELTQMSGLSGRWTWCPKTEQIEADDRYTLTLGADDMTNPKTEKHYLIVLRQSTKQDCPGEAPVVEHTPEDEQTLAGLTIAATVRDDQGLKNPPLLYYSTEAPSEPPDLSSMEPIEMLQVDGDRMNGMWAADVPNPVADDAAGTSEDVHYVIVAKDDDDGEGTCDHLTQSPDGSSYSMTVTNPGGSGDVALCGACSADVQCAGADNLCVGVGSTNEPFCLESCTDGSCPSGFTCSSDEVTSVDGNTGRQCIPDAGSCSDSAQCQDDDFEDNDSRAEADAAPALPQGSHELVSCPGEVEDDEDFFRVEVAGESVVTATLEGGGESDLDLRLLNDDGARIDLSNSTSSSEEVSFCVQPGTYFLRVNAFSSTGETPYTLTWDESAADCQAQCEDDASEDDDGLQSARSVTGFPSTFESNNNEICPTDSDFYDMFLFAGETIIVDMTFFQSHALEDLDLRFYAGDGTLLTPCSEDQQQLCTVDQGQSGTSDEHFEFTVEETDDYFLEVWGFDGSSNSYDLRIELQEP